MSIWLWNISTGFRRHMATLSLGHLFPFERWIVVSRKGGILIVICYAVLQNCLKIAT